jgi:DNA-binding MarR family transcriptional regulator
MQLLLDASNRPASAEGCAATLLDALPSVMWFVRQNMRSRRSQGLSVPQFRVLVLLHRYPEASLSAVSEHLGSTLPTASRIVGGLVGKGLVARRSCSEDRRQVALQLTDKGRSVLDVAWQDTRSAVAERLSKLTVEQHAGVMGAMDLLRDVFASDLGAFAAQDALRKRSG